MRISLLIPLAFASLLLFSNCRRVEKILPRLDGDWQITYYEEFEYDNSELIARNQITEPGYITFFENGTAIRDFNGFLTDFDWNADEGNDLVTLCEIPEIGIPACFNYTVQNSRDKFQRWEGTAQEGTYVLRIRMEMKRVQ